MKTLLLSDFHGSNPISEINRLRKQGIERVVCLGDYDDPAVLEALLELDMDKVLLVGNHDYRFANGKGIFSPYVGLSLCEEYIADWLEHPNESDYVSNSEFVFIDELNGRKIAYSHSSLLDNDKDHLVGFIDDRLSESADPEQGAENRAKNFMEMRLKDYWIFFKGHEHMHFVWSVGDDAEKQDKGHPEVITFEQNRRYIVCIPCYRQGGYAIFDSDKCTIKFSNLYEGE